MLTKNDLKQIRVVVKEEIKEEVKPIKKQLDVVETKVKAIETKVNTIEMKVEIVNKRVDQLDGTVRQLGEELIQTEQRLGKAIIKSQEETIEVLSDLIHAGYNLHEKRIRKIENKLQITTPQQ